MTGMEGIRKQTGSPAEQAQRKPPPQAWKGTNPITQRSSNPTPSTANGTTKLPASTKNTGASGIKESSTGDKHANDRLMFLFAKFIGLPAIVSLRNGEQYSGIFSGGSPDPSEPLYVLKMVKRLESRDQQQSNGVAETSDEYIGQGEDHVMAFDCQDVVDLNVANVSTDKVSPRGQNGVSSSLRTDADISGNLASRERNLQRWEPSGDSSLDLSLDSSGRDWDQFETNKRLYGVQSSYNEEIYTTKIDKSHPEYAQRAANAERIAREIEGGAAASAHVAEERGLKPVDDSGLDEEDKYSSVRRDYEPLPTGNPNKYTPPARRPPAGQPTVPGAPVDSAIIHASVAKPAASPSLPQEAAAPEKSEAAPEKPPQPPEVKPSANSTVTEQPSSNSLQANTLLHERKLSDANKKGRVENASETVEKDLFEQFKQFASTERTLASNQAKQRLNKDKQMKINDLKKFAQNFKLNTPVPTDLVPILAKDEKKQQEIVEKAKQSASETKAAPPKPTPPTGPVSEQKNTRPAPPNQQAAMPPASQNQQRRQPPNQYGSYRNMQGQHPAPRQPLGQRLSYNQQQFRAGMPPQGMPGPGSIQIPPPAPQGMNNGMQSPTRFNAGAREFKPNPAAHTFSPTVNQSTASSPRHDSTRPASKDLSDFFEGRPPPPPDQHPSYMGLFDPLKRMREEVAADEKLSKDYHVNSGIPFAYKTAPTWEVPEANVELTYVQALERTSVNFPPIASPPHIMQGGPIAHQHQLPLHLQQNGPMVQQGPTPHQTPRHVAAQPHHPQPGPHHFDDHRMQYSQSQSSIHPSPRTMPQFMAVNAPNGQPMPIYGQPLPAYGVSPSGHTVAFRQLPAGAQFVAPQPTMMGGHMMAQTPSQGPYIVQPGMHMYQQSPAPGHVYPHHVPTAGGAPMPGQAGAPNGYPSPRPAPMMQPQGSQQGHTVNVGVPVPQGPSGAAAYMPHAGMQGGPMFAGQASGPMAQMRQPFPQQQPHGQPHYGSSPHPQQYHGPHRGTPSAQYVQPMMSQHNVGVPPPPMQQQMPPQMEALSAESDGK